MNALNIHASLADRARDAVLRLLPDVEAIYVFGSVARGDAHVDSDLDLAVLGAGPLAALRRFELQRELSALLDRDVDLVDLHIANSVLRVEAIAHGRRPYARDADYALDFEARALGDYAALLDATSGLREAIRVRGRVYAR
jgi:predicted nucleotidyltransferase